MEFNRCYGCMEETMNDPCPHCGYVPDGKGLQYALRPGSILGGFGMTQSA